jgi:CspA family cold shock protein
LFRPFRRAPPPPGSQVGTARQHAADRSCTARAPPTAPGHRRTLFAEIPYFSLLSPAIAVTRQGLRLRPGTDCDQILEIKMATGKVKWFNPTKGYGFIQPSGGGQDVFVHISAVERAGLSTLNENQDVEFEIVSNRGKSSAENLKVK